MEIKLDKWHICVELKLGIQPNCMKKEWMNIKLLLLTDSLQGNKVKYNTYFHYTPS